MRDQHVSLHHGAPLNGNSLRVGSYFGYNWQFGERWVAGLEGDWAWANSAATNSGFSFFVGPEPPDSSFSVRSNWDASARARLGYLATPNVLVYATGGAAWLDAEATSRCGAESCFPVSYLPLTVSHAAVRSGWTLGGGVESMLGSHWIVRAEYRYSDFGSTRGEDIRPCVNKPDCATPASLNVGYDVPLKSQTVMLGIAYKFGGP